LSAALPGAGDPSLAAAYVAPVRGDPNAPVTIVEYGDFQCPSCGAFARSTAPELIRRYVDTGKVKIVWKNFAWIGNESKLAAQAAACAGAQGQFWAYHDYLYAHQRGENAGAFSAANLKSFATALALDRAAFDPCVDSGRYLSVVDKDASEVRGLGLTGTPTFVINGARLVGAQPLSVFTKVIEEKLAGR
jgi:protein-disulfide isomerase